MLRSPGDRQRAWTLTSTWIRRAGDGSCVHTHSDSFYYNYTRRAMTWRPRRKIHLRLLKRHKPSGLVIRMYVKLNDSGSPTGPGRRARYRLRPARRAGRRIWIAGFYGRRDARRHLYLGVRVGYRDVEGCGGRQTKVMTFHLRRRAKHPTVSLAEALTSRSGF